MAMFLVRHLLGLPLRTPYPRAIVTVCALIVCLGAMTIDALAQKRLITPTCAKHYKDDSLIASKGNAVQRELIDQSADINAQAVDLAQQGDMKDAEVQYRKALTIVQNIPHAYALRRAIYQNLGELYRKQGRTADSYAVTLKVIEEIEKSKGFDPPIIASTLQRDADLFLSTAKQESHFGSRPFPQTSMDDTRSNTVSASLETLQERVRSVGGLPLALALSNLGLSLAGQDRLLSANHVNFFAVILFAPGTQLRRDCPVEHAIIIDNMQQSALDAIERGGEHVRFSADFLSEVGGKLASVVGSQNHDVGINLLLQGRTLRVEKKPKEATDKLLSAVRILSNDSRHRRRYAALIDAYHWLAAARQDLNDTTNAQAALRTATRIITASDLSPSAFRRTIEGLIGSLTLELEQIPEKERSGDRALDVKVEAFHAAQLLHTSAASRALNSTLARARGGEEISAIIRELDKTNNRAKTLQNEIADVDAISVGDPSQSRMIASKQAELVSVEQRSAALTMRVKTQFPAYFDLIKSEPLQFSEISKLLSQEEALVFFHIADSRLLVFVVFQGGNVLFSVNVRLRDLDRMVYELREGLPKDGKPIDLTRTRFDVALANELFKLTLGPVHPVFKQMGIEHLLLVPAGPLSALPFHALVTQAPKPGAGYKDAAWLMKDYAVTIVPSVLNLRDMRTFSPKLPAASAYLGIGDPVLGAAPKIEAAGASDAPGQADVEKLRALPNLRFAGEELESVAREFGLDRSVLLTGLSATETVIKWLNADGALKRYQVIHFATHALVAGELVGADQPGIVLTPPPATSAEEDGLLTAEEIAGLDLNAELVVLSACNTAAGQRSGTDALSGLARAFFLAGSQSLLITHWPVLDQSARVLMHGMFSTLRDAPNVSKAEALRRVMHDVVRLGSEQYAHPAFWSVFFVVGDSTVRR
jgi:CHAT domain-containing protein